MYYVGASRTCQLKVHGRKVFRMEVKVALAAILYPDPGRHVLTRHDDSVCGRSAAVIVDGATGGTGVCWEERHTEYGT